MSRFLSEVLRWHICLVKLIFTSAPRLPITSGKFLGVAPVHHSARVPSQTLQRRPEVAILTELCGEHCELHQRAKARIELTLADLHLDGSVVLSTHVVEVVDPDNLDRNWVADALQHSVDCVDPGRFGPAFAYHAIVNHDLARQTVTSKARVKNLVATVLLRRLDSVKSRIFSSS